MSYDAALEDIKAGLEDLGIKPGECTITVQKSVYAKLEMLVLTAERMDKFPTAGFMILNGIWFVKGHE